MTRATLGVIVGNRDFFPDALVTEARADVLALFEEMGIEPVILDAEATKLGGVETWREAQVCAELFDQRRKDIAVDFVMRKLGPRAMTASRYFVALTVIVVIGIILKEMPATLFVMYLILQQLPSFLCRQVEPGDQCI